MTFDMVSNVISNSTQANSLTLYAMSYPSFADSEYIIFCDSDYSYYIVWGDLKKNDDVVTGGDVEYIHYYRTSTSSYNSEYVFEYGTDTSFELSLAGGYVPTSNIAEVGFVSTLAQEYQVYDNVLAFLVLAVSMLFAIMIKVLRGSRT